MSAEQRPLQSNGPDRETPQTWGSHKDKICLLPFLALVTALGYYGGHGVKSFNIYQYGAQQADLLCSPLNGLQDQCRGKLREQVAKAAKTSHGQAATALQDSTQVALKMHKKVAEACSGIEIGLNKCDVVHGFISNANFLKLPSIPTLQASAKSPGRFSITSVLSRKGTKHKASSFVDSLTSKCTTISKDIKSACSSISKAMTSGGAKVDGALQVLAGDAAVKVNDAMLKALAKASSSICPALKGVPKACDSLKAAAKDALQEAETAAEDALPKEVPMDLLQGALSKASDAATSFVDHICKGVTDIDKDCPALFAKSRWQPLMGKVQEPLKALRQQFKEALDVVKGKVAEQCTSLTSQVEKACSTTTDSAGALVSQIGTSAAASSTKKTAELQKSLKTLHGHLDEHLSKVSKSLGVVAQGCTQVGKLVKARCEDFRTSRASFTDLAKKVDTSLQTITDAGTRTDEACSKVGSMHETCLNVANPFAVLAKGATGLWQHRFAEIVQLEIYLLIGCSITAVVMLGVVRCATKAVVTISICLNLGVLFATAMLNLFVMNLPGAAMFGSIFLLKATWLWCIRGRFDFAVVLIHAAVETVENGMGIGVWILGIVLIAMQVACLTLTGGAWYYLMGVNAPPEAVQLQALVPGLIPVLLVFTLAWTVEVIANILHVTVCCNIGAECGVDTPAKSVCGSFVFSTLGAIGSICFGSFIIALVKALQYAYEKGTNSKNPCVQVIIRVACCIIQWALQLFNSYAFVFVGLKGESYYVAATRTAETFAKDGCSAVAADEALHDVVHVIKFVGIWVSVLLSLIFGHQLDLIGWTERSWQEAMTGPVLCIAMAVATSYVLSLVMGRLLEAAVCVLFIVYDDDVYSRCMKTAKPELFNELQAAYEGKKNESLLE